VQSYLTHHFAHLETLDRAYRWLIQIGFDPARIELHRDRNPSISVRASQDQQAEAELIFEAAELNDPDGWPSFWERAKTPQPHFEPTPESATASTVISVRPSPVGWNPPDRETACEFDEGMTEIFDVSTRFA